MGKEQIVQLIEAALQAREKAYAPYSRFQVGAALLCADGSIYTGCNVENASYPASNCAERTAVFKAVSEGKKDFLALAVMGGVQDGERLSDCMPCGICRQVLAEFAAEDLTVITGASAKDYRQYTLGELLPQRISKKNLQ